MKNTILILFLTMLINITYATTFTTTGSSANWSDPIAWDNGVPTFNDNDSIIINDSIKYIGDLNVNSYIINNNILNIEGIFSPKNYTMNDAILYATNFNMNKFIDTIYLSGYINIGEDLNLSSNSKLIIVGCLELNITNDFNIIGNSEFYLNCGDINIDGDLNINGSSYVNIISNTSISNINLYGSPILTLNYENNINNLNMHGSSILFDNGELNTNNINLYGNSIITGNGILSWTNDLVYVGNAKIMCNDSIIYYSNKTTPSIPQNNPLDLAMCDGPPLPIILQYFKGVYNNNYINLEWSTLIEINCSHYIIEKSYDNENWEYVTLIEGSNNSSNIVTYNYEDLMLSNDAVYYRLTQYDFNGDYQTFDVISILPNFNNFKIYPNPVDDNKYLNIISQSNIEILMLHSINGKQVYVPINDQIDLNNLPTGIYNITLKFENNDEIYKIKIYLN